MAHQKKSHKKPNPISHAARKHHKIHHEKHLQGHRVVVKGLYLARAAKRDGDGTSQKSEVPYQEEFVINEPKEHLLDPHVAMAHVLKDLLPARLVANDPDFRGIKTHEVHEHENLFETDAQHAKRLKEEQEALDAEDKAEKKEAALGEKLEAKQE